MMINLLGTKLDVSALFIIDYVWVPAMHCMCQTCVGVMEGAFY